MCSCSSVAEAVERVLDGVGGLDEELLVLVDLRDRAEAALVERAGRFDAAEGWRDDGEYSFACWLRSRADVTRVEAGALARLAFDLRAMRATEAAVADGKLSVAKARLMAGVVNERTRAQFDKHEAFLLDQIQGLDLDQTKIALRHWQRMADRDGPDPSDPTRNRATIDVGWDGRTHLDADLDPVGGAVVKATLDAIIDRMHQDGRFNDLGGTNTAARRRADALVEMAHRASGRTPDQPAVHPKIIVIVPWERLLQRQADPLAPPPELIGTGPIDLADVGRLTLLGTVAALTLDADGRPLNLGPEVRLASDDQVDRPQGPRPRLRRPGLRPPRRVVLSPPPPLLLPRRPHRPRQPLPPLQPPPPPHPRPALDAGGGKGRRLEAHPPRRSHRPTTPLHRQTPQTHRRARRLMQRPRDSTAAVVLERPQSGLRVPTSPHM